MTKVASYFASLSFQLDRASMKLVDRQLMQTEKKITSFSKRLQKKLTLDMKSFVLPELKVKKFEFDPLSLQRNAQTELNRVSRLLTLDIRNFNFDQSKINRQMQGVMQRAANASRINVKTIQGSAGGSNAYFPQTKVSKAITQYASPHHQSPVMASTRDALAGAGMALLPGRLAMFSGPALAVAAPIGAGIGIERQAVALGNEQAEREAQRTQLDIASAAPDRATRDKRNKEFFNLSNRLGVEASTLVDPYSKFLKQMQTMGRSYDQGMSLFTNMAVATRGSGGGQQQMERQAYALQQVIGLGHLRSEELNLQLADSNPAIKKYIIEAWEQRTGGKGLEQFQKAMQNRQVSVEDVFKAYENAARDAAGRVDEFASTVKGAQARLANVQFEEQLSRTISDDVIPSMRKYVEAQNELYTAMQPFRNLMYDASAAILSFNANLLKKSAPFINELGKKLDGSSIVRDPLTYLPALNPVTSTIQLGYLANKHLMGGEDQSSLTAPSPLIPKGYSWKSQADQFYDITKAIPTSNTNNVTVGDVNISLSSNATNGQQLADELKFVVRQELKDAVTGALQNYPQLE